VHRHAGSALVRRFGVGEGASNNVDSSRTDGPMEGFYHDATLELKRRALKRDTAATYRCRAE